MAEDIFEEFKTSESPLANTEEPAKRKRKRGPRRAAAANGASPKPKKLRKKREAAAAVPDAPPAPRKTRTKKDKAPRAVKIDLQTALSATIGMQQEDAALFGKIVEALQKQPKGARARIVGALGKVFA